MRHELATSTYFTDGGTLQSTRTPVLTLMQYKQDRNAHFELYPDA